MDTLNSFYNEWGSILFQLAYKIKFADILIWKV